MNLLNDGSHYMAEDEPVKKAVLLLGNTGAGKTTITQIVAGDLSRIHAVLTQGGELVIVDDDNRIGAPTTISKTLIPELVMKQDGEDVDSDQENRTAFYDCPGFDDTRGPEEDIAANFFMNQIVRRVNRVKLLFLVIQSSVKAGHDRLDFDLLASHATKFLKNIPNYSKSIGLVVTKVDSFNHRGKFVSGEDIVKGIVDFLRNYNQTLNSQLESDSNRFPKSELKRKIQFVEALLQQDGNGTYDRISFSRSPVNCGPLSRSNMIGRTKQRVIKLYTDVLEYSPVNWRDFGYTLKDKTKLTLRGYVTSLNEQVVTGISALMNDFGKWAHSKYFGTMDIAQIMNELEKVATAMESLVGSLNGLRNSSNPQAFLEIVRPTLEKLGYSIPIKVKKYMGQQQAYFDWFDEVNASPVTRSLRDWVEPVDMSRREFVELREWYEFVKDLQTRVGAYGWQSSKPKMPRRDVDWLNFLEWEGGIKVRSSIKDLSSKLGGIHTEVVGKIMGFALKPVEVKCEGDVATITGNYVRLTEFITGDSHWPLFLSQCDGDDAVEHKRIEIYATHTVYIDDDVDAEGMELNLVIIAPNWVVVGGNKQINLNGSPASQHSTNKVEDGEAMAGRSGGPGGSFFGLAQHTKDIGKLKVTTIGGRGGNGQDGRKGGHGTTSYVPDFDEAPSYETWNFIVYKYSKHRHEGYPGYSGSDGGDGGAPGQEGKPGKVKFLGEGDGDIDIVREYGRSGEPGVGGEGGIGGKHSEGIHCTRKTIFFGIFGDKKECERRRYKYGINYNGSTGLNGASLAGFVKPKLPDYIVVEWESILNFKLGAIPALEHNETKAFIQFLESDISIRSYFGVEAFAKELGAIMEKGLDDTLLPSYISRLEAYTNYNYKNWRSDKRKVVAYLLASAYSNLVVSDQDHGMGMVVDLGQFFNVVEKRMNKLKESSALAAIEDEKATFGKDIQEKIKEVRRFQEEVVNPAVHEAEEELKTSLRNLEKQFEKFVMDAEGNLDMSMNRLTIGIEEEEHLKFKQVIGLVGAVVRLAELVGGFFGIFETGLPILWDSTVGLFNSGKAFVSGVSEMGAEEGRNFGTVLALGGELLESAANFTETLKVTLDEVGEDLDDDLQSGVSQPSTALGHNITTAITYLGEEMMTKLHTKSGSDSERTSRLNRIVRDAEMKLKDARNRKLAVEKSFLPVVATLVGSLEWMMADLQNKSHTGTIEASELGIRKWQITRVLRDTKVQLEMLGKGVETREFVNAIDRVKDSLTMQIDLIEDIVKYEETWKLAQYMTAVNTASVKTVQVSDPILSSSVAKMEKAIVTNSYRKDYQKALHAFKQWVFPFAKLHLTKDLQLKGKDSTGDTFVKQVETLKLKWERYKGSTLSAHDTHLIHTNFSSSHRSSSPFFVWRNDKWSPDIHDLLSGKAVHLKADVRQSQKGKDAVKFKLIEINCKIPEGKQTQRENQQSLDSELRDFAVVMTHSGVSYYRFQGNFYVMTGANQTIQYNFERDSGSGNRLGTNRVYQKFKSGDYLLSPYTLWTIQLIRASPRISRNAQRNFQSLERFAPYVDLELVGAGIYIQGERIRDDMEVDKYYMRDESVREDVDLP